MILRYPSTRAVPPAILVASLLSSVAHAEIINVTPPGSSSLVTGTTSITGGATTQVLFNNGGVVSSDAGLTKAAGATGAVAVGGSLAIGGGSPITSSGAGGALGTAAFQSTGTSGATIPFLNGTNTWAGVNTYNLEPVVSVTDAATNTVTELIKLEHLSSGTPTTSFGSGIGLYAANASGTSKTVGALRNYWTTATNGSESSELDIMLMRSGTLTTLIQASYQGLNGAVGILGSATVNGQLDLANNLITRVTKLQIGGSAPTGSGSCAINTQTGGNTAGTFSLNGTCTAGTVILTFVSAATTGWACSATDRTTPTDTFSQTASSTTTATLTGTGVSADVVQFWCVGY